MKGEADAQDLILHVNSKSTKSEDARKTSGMMRTNNSKGRILGKPGQSCMQQHRVVHYQNKKAPP
jgi:hypothetical protein